MQKTLEQTQTEFDQHAQQMTEEASRAQQRAVDAMLQGQRQASNASVTVGASTQNGLTKTITFPDGRGGVTTLTITGDGVQFGAPGSMPPIAFDRVIPSGVVDMTYAIGLTLVLVFVGGPIARAFARRMDRRTIAPTVPAEVLQRLAAIEQSIDTVAVEVERISEGQRFTTRLLAERAHEPVV